MRVYLDTCCLGRPFDDQSDDIVRLETEALALILQRIQNGEWTWVVSDVLFRENSRDSQVDRRQDVRSLLELGSVRIHIELNDLARAAELHRLGFSVYDLFHLVAAEKAHCDVLLTTDVKLVRRAARVGNRVRVKVRNPITWLTEIGQ